MSVRVTDYTSQIINDVEIKSNAFLRVFAEDVVKEAESVTPKRLGDLRNNVLKEILGLKGKIKWIKDYAVYQETKQYKNYTTPGTGPHFAEDTIKKMVDKTREIAGKVGLIK